MQKVEKQKGKKEDSKGWNDSKGWTVGKGWSEGKGWNTSGKGWEQQRPAGMNNLERDSKQYDVLVMETSTPEKTVRDGREVQNLEFVVLQQMHTTLMALTSYEATDMVANSRKNPLEEWRRLQRRDDPTTGGRKRNLLRPIISL